MLHDDGNTAVVKTLHESYFPKNTVGNVITCRFIPGTTERVYLFQTSQEVSGMVSGPKVCWYLERDLANV